MNDKLTKIAEEKGVCCVYMLFAQTMSWPTKRLANELGVTTRCVRQRRRALREADLVCPRLPGCQRNVSS